MFRTRDYFGNGHFDNMSSWFLMKVLSLTVGLHGGEVNMMPTLQSAMVLLAIYGEPPLMMMPTPPLMVVPTWLGSGPRLL
jgi:hypothetical protein